MINNLPLAQQIETPKVLKKAISANRALANLNGVARIISNNAIHKIRFCKNCQRFIVKI